MNLVRIPRILRIFFPGMVYHLPGDKVLYLTFDDGPTPGITSAVLSILKEYKARATFFCIGRNAERHAGIMHEIRENGHAIGNHTYSHLKGWYTPDREYYADIGLASLFVPSGLFRPAYGLITPAQVRFLKNKFRIVMWDVMSFDFNRGTTPQQCLSNVLQNARPGSVVVFHDSVKASEKVLFALPKVLEHFGNLGYRFEAIPTPDPPYTTDID